MSGLTCCDGHELKGMFSAATRWLERSAELINSLNVFPVPDGDTGTNMLLTMRAAMEEANTCSDGNASAVAEAMARGSLMGARGNSGVILSQILRGLAKGLDGKSNFDGNDLARALVESSALAYKGMSKPVEGTILTVIREVSSTVCSAEASHTADVVAVMEEVVEEAKASVARTPSLLPVLRQAGVVDAGGHGLYVVFEGALRYLRGELEAGEIAPAESLAPTSLIMPEEAHYGYCTEFLLRGNDLSVEAIREKLVSLGESVLVVGDDTTVRAHLHTFDPGYALSYATSLGVLQQTKVENMDAQHHDFIMAQSEASTEGIAVIAVASGEGLTEAFYSIGAAAVVPGGETMNPSVQQIVDAVEAVPADKVIILPDNPNIVLAAEQASSLTRKTVAVVPTKTIPQGIASLLVFNSGADLDTNVSAMNRAILTVYSGEITRAIRSTDIDGFSVKEGEAIAFLNGELAAANPNVQQVVLDLLAKCDVQQGGLVTIYYGGGAQSSEAEQIAALVRESYPDQEVDVVAGGQPYYDFIVSVE